MTAELSELTEHSPAGVYAVSTASGSVYVVSLDPDRATMETRPRDPLYGRDEPLPINRLQFRVGQGGLYHFTKPGGFPLGTFRVTTPVLSIRVIQATDIELELGLAQELEPGTEPFQFDHATDEDGADVEGGVLVRIHPIGDCAGRPCYAHAPSDHPLRHAPLRRRADRWLIERLCEHGVGHDDPDDLAYRQSIDARASGVHDCDGCCRS